MGADSLWHWIIVIGVVLLLFGRGKVSDLMGDVAQGIKAFKKGLAEDATANTGADRSAPAAADHGVAMTANASPPTLEGGRRE